VIALLVAVAVAATPTPTPAPFGKEWADWYIKTCVPLDHTISAEFATAGVTPTVIPTVHDDPKTYVWIEKGVFVDLRAARLYVIRYGDALASFPCAYGFLTRKGHSVTPIGDFKVEEKHKLSPGAGTLPKYGTRIINLNIRPTGVLRVSIHGTDQPEFIGKPVSDGCIRMLNKDVEVLYRLVGVGDDVVIWN
jgi:lipoprotein-anchoring transpeptidase ErfK/SrfK